MKRGVLLGILCVVGAILLGYVVSTPENSLRALDQNLHGFLYPPTSNVLRISMVLATQLGSSWFAIALSIVVLAVWTIRRRKIDIAIWLVSLGITELLATIMKNFFLVERPISTIASASGFSYPSGHAATAAVVFTLLFLFIRSHLKKSWQKDLLLLCSVGIIVLVSVSRLVLGVHWLSDVIGGTLLGSGVALASYGCLTGWKLSRKAR